MRRRSRQPTFYAHIPSYTLIYQVQVRYYGEHTPYSTAASPTSAAATATIPRVADREAALVPIGVDPPPVQESLVAGLLPVQVYVDLTIIFQVFTGPGNSVQTPTGRVLAKQPPAVAMQAPAVPTLLVPVLG